MNAAVVLLAWSVLGDVPPAAPDQAPSASAPATASSATASTEKASTEKASAGAPSAEDLHEATRALAFADHLFHDGDWYRAITEYRRYLYLVKGQGAEAGRAATAIGEALARGEQWDAAGRQLDGVAQRTTEVNLRREALFSAGRAYLLDGRPELAKPRFRLIVEDGEADQGLRVQSTWLLGWGHFDAGELDDARTYFDRLANTPGEHQTDSAGVVAALDGRTRLETKDPLLAGLLSIVPGVGHFYLGQVAVGVTSLVWNGLFVFATVNAILAGDWGVAAVLTLFELGWYSGGIFGAVAGAFRHNRDVVKNWRDDVLLKYGASRELPDLKEVERAPPGTIIRFGGAF